MVAGNWQDVLNQHVGAALRAEMESIVTEDFERIKKDTISEFMLHPVTMEIQDGPYASNLSATLGGYGNLFTFIGFVDGYEPITPILEALESSSVSFGRVIRGGIEMRFNIPSKENIWDATPLPWADGRSWAKGIEQGISGVGNYLHSHDKVFQRSRSGPAIQTKSKTKKGRFRNVRYMSGILARFEEKLSNLK